ncbi:MAG: hypothetical protein LBL90_09550 [Prevotellaceae bacterium]|jgi:nitrogen fixation/metabolism regulation signal transduction histidine kinase|nr:hypothetical protein [Prevotellaceae bacterium]
MKVKSHRLFWVSAIIITCVQIIFGFYFAKTNITLFFIIEGFALLSCILFIRLYNLLIKPFKLISEGIDLIKAQDFSSRLREINNAEVNKAVSLFNQMMAQLKEERLHLREQNHFLDLLINASPLGFVILDFDDRISQINPAGLRLLNINDIESVTGKKLSETKINIAKPLAELQENDDIVLRVSGITMYRCSRSSFIDRGFPHSFILIEELTHELLQVEKKSYEGIIRMMAHEVNNSIAAVNSTFNVISDTLQTNPGNELYDALPAVDASINRCIHLSQFISNFAGVVKIPLPTFSKVDIHELLHNIESVFRVEFQRRTIRLTFNLADNPFVVLADGIQLEQVFINIVKNACEAICENGDIRITTTTLPYNIRIENNGEGISKEIEDKLFIPFFTTKPNGQGIGLMFIREVLINHNYNFSLSTINEWTSFEINGFKSI